MSETIVLPPGGGRVYEIGSMRGVFKADEEGYCASEWSVEPHETGPGAHSHPEQDEVFIVTEGTMWFLTGEEWVEAPAGTFLRIPAGITHDFENRSDTRAVVFNVFVPGRHFEAGFAEWAAKGSSGDQTRLLPGNQARHGPRLRSIGNGPPDTGVIG